jgi:hypothetical protein
MMMRAMCLEVVRPMCFQVSPPSVDFHTPLPHDPLWRLLFSPLPTQTVLASLGGMAMSPIDTTSSRSSKCTVQVVPWFTVFHSPPVAVPT